MRKEIESILKSNASQPFVEVLCYSNGEGHKIGMFRARFDHQTGEIKEVPHFYDDLAVHFCTLKELKAYRNVSVELEDGVVTINGYCNMMKGHSNHSKCSRLSVDRYKSVMSAALKYQNRQPATNWLVDYDATQEELVMS